MRWSGCVVLRPLPPPLFFLCPPLHLNSQRQRGRGRGGLQHTHQHWWICTSFGSKCAISILVHRWGDGFTSEPQPTNTTCISTMTTAYDTRIHIEISMPCVISKHTVDLATIATQTTYLREMGISVIILGDAQVQLWHINQHATALMKMFSSTLKTTKSQSLFSNQVHIVTRGVTRATDTPPTPETQAVCRLVDEVCRSVGCGLRVVAQHDNSGQIWLGRRGYMDQSRLEPLFRHIYGTGSPRYTSHAQTHTHP
jgi:hypothetical protein